MAQTILNTDLLMLQIRETINKEMAAVAEPIIQKALDQAAKELEVAMRKTMASCLISVIDRNFSMEHHGTDLRILVHQEKK